MIEFVLGLWVGIVLAGWACWNIYKKEMNEWKSLFKEILPQVAGYKNLKDMMK